MQATEAERIQQAAEEMLAHHQQLAALEHDRHTVMLRNMQVAEPLSLSVTSHSVMVRLPAYDSSTLLLVTCCIESRLPAGLYQQGSWRCPNSKLVSDLTRIPCVPTGRAAAEGQ